LHPSGQVFRPLDPSTSTAEEQQQQARDFFSSAGLAELQPQFVEQGYETLAELVEAFDLSEGMDAALDSIDTERKWTPVQRRVVWELLRELHNYAGVFDGETDTSAGERFTANFGPVRLVCSVVWAFSVIPS